MGQKVVTFRVEKASALGALHLLSRAPGHLSPRSPLAPVMLYLETLARTGARSQRGNLVRAARLLGGASGLDYDWASLRASHLEFLRGTLKGSGYAPSLINSVSGTPPSSIEQGDRQFHLGGVGLSVHFTSRTFISSEVLVLKEAVVWREGGMFVEVR